MKITLNYRGHHMFFVGTAEYSSRTVEHYKCDTCGQTFYKKAGAPKKTLWGGFSDLRRAGIAECKEVCIKDVIE